MRSPGMPQETHDDREIYAGRKVCRAVQCSVLYDVSRVATMDHMEDWCPVAQAIASAAGLMYRNTWARDQQFEV